MKRQTSILLRLLALALATAGLAAPALGQGSEAQPEKFQRTFTLNPGSTLLVDNYKGTIHVTGSSTNQVVVNVVKRFDGSDSDRKWWMENTTVDFSNDNSRVQVKVHYPNQTWSCWLCGHGDYTAEVELEIQAPRQTNLEIESFKPDIKVLRLNGDIRIKSYKSPMTIESTTGSIRIDTYKDSIRLKDINVRGALEIKSFKADAEIDATSLGERADLESSKGTIVLRVPQNAGLTVDFQGGRRSSFSSDFALNAEAGSRFGRDFHGTINQGGASVRLRTDKGSVELRKLSAAL
ncbi:MAG TPA: hypothetical protein VKE93_04790 [Candidatus Angelobacter sp.]|nr:hypothetical protein [Candidatus Angelobacter sp.]